MIKELDDQDESPHVSMSETKEKMQDECPTFNEEGDCIFVVMVHPVNPHISFVLRSQCPV
jgi:hypothetical protein